MTQNRPFTNFASINNGRILWTRSPRIINQRGRRIQYRRRRNANFQHINNEEMLNRIVNLPMQATNDPFINGFFNGE
ncbi:13074_t:CDS:2 [Funneliformis mosseae]|uniref:13074_t:CDS:1 n=1 Tax=Funneliformis mosseae TaxID=27381 RepID=A0A9N8Z8D3_FUNMO|nr:13074_t:CDS:2 [Funneliformis mosseae]